MIARILIIAGSDSGGGAGIQADIKTVAMLGGHAMTAITAITAQNTLGVQAVHPVPTDIVLAQIDSCVSDIGVDAVKIGMLGSAETAHAVADRLEGLDVPIVFDPVMIATSGDALADADTIAVFRRLMKIATVSTPNTDELRVLTGIERLDDHGVHDAAGGLAETLGTAILATGTRVLGGWIGGQRTDDLLFDRLFVGDVKSGFQEWEWHDKIIDTNQDHGTGCTLASAIAVGLGTGISLSGAVVRARSFVRSALANAPGLGTGHGPMGHAMGTVPYDALRNKCPD